MPSVGSSPAANGLSQGLPYDVIAIYDVIGNSEALAWNIQSALVDGSLDNNTIVDRAFKAYVLENRYLKVTLVPSRDDILPSGRTTRP